MDKQFEALRKKYSLPGYEELDRDFQIKSMDEKEDLIRGIVHHVFDTYDSYSRLLEELIQPDTKLSAMKEASELNAYEKKLLVECHRRIMCILREFIELNLSYSEKEAAKRITNAYNEWQLLKPDLSKIIAKMKETWKHQSKIDSERGYFG